MMSFCTLGGHVAERARIGVDFNSLVSLSSPR